MLSLLVPISAAAWGYLTLLHGRFWQSGPELPSPPANIGGLNVAVVIPARNEAEHIGATLHSLLAQQFAGELRIVLVNDNSTDGTGEIAQAIQQTDHRLTVINGKPLPEGWSGKMWAVSQGLEAAKSADYVLLTDADIHHEPLHLAQLISKAQAGNFDLVSEIVRLRCETAAERFGIPAFVFFFAMLYPFNSVADPHSKVAGAAGGTMLVSAEALRRIDGVSRIRAELIDDCALAREVKRGGHRLWLGHATQATSMREYPVLADIWNMVARTAYVQLNHSPLLLLGTVLGMLLLYAVPVVSAFATRGFTQWLGEATWLVMALLFQPILRRYRQSPLWGLALPAIAAFYLAATVGSAVRFYRGRGGQWKDRTYPAT